MTSCTSLTHCRCCKYCRLGNNTGLFLLSYCSLSLSLFYSGSPTAIIWKIFCFLQICLHLWSSSLRCVCAAFPRDQLPIKVCGQRDVLLFGFFSPFDVVVVCSAVVAVIMASSSYIYSKLTAHVKCITSCATAGGKGSSYCCKIFHC